MLINFRSISWQLGIFLFPFSLIMSLPLLLSALTDLRDAPAFIKALSITLLVASVLFLFGRNHPRRELKLREAIFLVLLVWLSVCLFGALPFYFSSSYSSFIDALFESVSGFTTTGATVLSDVEVLSISLHLWRSLSQWLGGMGIILLGIAVLPLIAGGGNNLYKSEFSGAGEDRLHPRLLQTARSLWKIYVSLTLVEFLLLMIAGMGSFDALCHAFTTIATGGFSTRTASIAAFNSAYIEYIVIVFMFLAGISFIQHFRLWLRHVPLKVLRDAELRLYMAIIFVATILVFFSTFSHADSDAEALFRSSLFQVISILTTTGFVTTDYSIWPSFLYVLLLLLMISGGCAGSTAGGLKIRRLLVFGKLLQREFQRRVEPQGVFIVRNENGTITDPILFGLVGLIFLALMLVGLSTLLVAASGEDLFTAFSAVISCTFNVGPGFGNVGPVDNYGALSSLAKAILSFCMIAGRLEFYTVFVVMTAAFWRR